MHQTTLKFKFFEVDLYRVPKSGNQRYMCVPGKSKVKQFANQKRLAIENPLRTRISLVPELLETLTYTKH